MTARRAGQGRAGQGKQEHKKQSGICNRVLQKKVQYWGDGIICEVFSATGKVKIQCTI